MYTLLLTVLFIIYYWYFYFQSSAGVQVPASQVPSAARPYDVEFTVTPRQDAFVFTVNGSVAWSKEIPSPFVFQDGALRERDACADASDGENVLAQGLPLYMHLRDRLLLGRGGGSTKASALSQTGKVYYFTCRGGRIHELRQCAAGDLFMEDRCQSLSLCYGRADGTVFPADTLDRYVRCVGGKEVLEHCPPKQIFVADDCYDRDNDYIFCSKFSGSLKVSDHTRLDCVNGRAVYTHCPPGTKFFDDDARECEPSQCDGQQDGTRIPMEPETRGPFTFVPGYYACRLDKVEEAVTCSDDWDPFSSRGDNLTHLPTVFDGDRCSVPEVCANVQPASDAIVPMHEFTKRAMNWEHAPLYDRLAGFRCQDGKKELVSLDPGQVIGEEYGAVPGCGPNVDHLPVRGNTSAYFECSSGTIRACRPSEEFDGRACRPILEKAFSLNDVPLFRFDGLSFDNWPLPWNYSPIKQALNCPPGEVLIGNFNVCSHADCAAYSFLPQLPAFSVQNRDGLSQCTYDPARKSIVKQPASDDEPLSYWKQHRAAASTEDCAMGQHLETENFVWNASVYATCDDAQPFVFCPSSDTAGIVRVGDRYACQLPRALQSSLFTGMRAFQNHELERIRPTRPNQTVEIASVPVPLPDEGLDLAGWENVRLRADEPVALDYRYRVTHPPDVAYEAGLPRASKFPPDSSAFLVKSRDFTTKPVSFPVYAVLPFADKFHF